MNDDEVKSLPVGRLIVWGLAIAFALTILLQNLEPLVVLYFLGRRTIPIPLSFAILVAFVSGAIAALIFNFIAFWRRRRRDRTISELYEEEEIIKQKGNPQTPPKQAPPKQSAKPKQQEFEDDDDYDENPSKYEDSYEYGKNPTRYQDEREVIDVKYIDRNSLN